MTTMIERVARAIYEADDPWHSAFPWPNLNEKQGGAEGYRRAARAAINAVADDLQEVLDRRKAKKQKAGNDYIAACITHLRRAALNEQVAG